MSISAKRKDPAVLVRFPKPLLRDLSAAAKKSGRSRNTEILFRLASTLAGEMAVSPANGEQGAR